MIHNDAESQKKEREKNVLHKIREEDIISQVQLQGVKEMVWDILINGKKFHPEEIKIDPQFILQLSNGDVTVSTDYIIQLNSLSFIAIKCSSSAIESWERYIKAFSRTVLDYQIPFAMVTDGENARIFDVPSNSLVGTSIDGLFTRCEALEKIKDFKKTPFPPEKLEREKRIVYAFEGIKCPLTDKC